nr:MAG TPA: hypothetical protein [Caudoviricetes sp.]
MCRGVPTDYPEGHAKASFLKGGVRMRRAIFNAKWLDSQLLASAHGKEYTASQKGSV